MDLGQQFRLETNRVNLPLSGSRWLSLLMALAAVAFAAFSFLVLARARTFINRVVDDPFHPLNAHDLSQASRAALQLQIVLLLLWIINFFIWPASRVAQQLEQMLGGIDHQVTVEYTVLPMMWVPLLVWAVCAVLAAVFQRGHDLREQERRLREEQELTI